MKKLVLIGKGFLPDLLFSALVFTKKFEISYFYTGQKRPIFWSNEKRFQENIEIIESKDEMEERLFGSDALVISAHNQYIFNQNLTNKNEILNLHMGLLPQFRGLYPIPNALRLAPKDGGVTLHRIDEYIDKGIILAQRRIDLTQLSSVEGLFIASCLAIDLVIDYFNIGSNKIGADEHHQSNENYSSTLAYFDASSIDFDSLSFNLNEIDFDKFCEIKSLIFPPLNMPVVEHQDRRYHIYSAKLLRSSYNIAREEYISDEAIIVRYETYVLLLFYLNFD